jgi:hypothetical protein
VAIIAGGGTGISFTFYGEPQLERRIVGMYLRTLDASPAFEAIGDSFARVEKRQFSSEGAYGSGGWAPLSPTYAAWKQRHYPGKLTLAREGALEESLTRRPFGIDVVERQFAIFGSDVRSESGFPYGRAHQKGIPGRLPRRRPIDLPESIRRRWVKVLQRWIMENSLDRSA